MTSSENLTNFSNRFPLILAPARKVGAFPLEMRRIFIITQSAHFVKWKLKKVAQKNFPKIVHFNYCNSPFEML